MRDFAGNARFEIKRHLGRGGFGVVYEAYDREREASVALKVLVRSSPSDLLRFKREFRALSDISHPNLVRLYELQQHDDTWFFTMELVRGRNFVKHLRHRHGAEKAPSADSETATFASEPPVQATDEPGAVTPLPPRWSAGDVPRIRDVVAQLFRGVSHLHSMSMLHRDLKPSNVLVDQDGHLRVLDFGLVHHLDRDDRTDSQRITGTPRYMSPEQAGGCHLSPATDLYSIGVMLFEALTGRPPFRGTPSRILAAKRELDAPRADSLNPLVPLEFVELCAGLLNRDPARRRSAAAVLRAVDGTGAAGDRASHTRSQRTPFVGRVDELEALHGAVAETGAGSTVVMPIAGTSGIGKTALVGRFLDSLRGERDVLIFAGRCYEQESVPYKAVDSVIDAMSRYLRRLPVPEQQALLPRNAGALARLFPVLRQVETVARKHVGVPDVPDSRELRRRAFGALRDLVGRLAERGQVILFIDDVQWGDVDSASLLEELIRPPDPPPLLLIGTYREEEAQTSAFLEHALVRLRDAGPALVIRELHLEPLAEAEARILVGALEGSRSDSADLRVDEILHEARGNPFFVGELVRFGHETPSESGDADLEMRLNAAIRQRLGRLEADHRRLLEIVAVAGRPLPVSIASSAAEVGGRAQEIITHLRVERLARVRRSAGVEQLEPYHDRIRQTIVGALGAEALKERHRSLASALAAGDAQAEMLAAHLMASGDERGAARYAEQAGGAAMHALAFDQAARMYQLALALGEQENADPHELRLALAEALANAGRGAEAAEAFRSAMPTADPGARPELQRRAAEQLLLSGRIDAGLEACREVLASVGMRMYTSPWLNLAALLWYRARLAMRGLDFEERSVDDVAPSTLMRIDACWTMATGLGMVDPIQAAEFQARHLLLALEAGEPYRVSRALSLEVALRGIPGSGHRAEVEGLSRRAQALAARIGDEHAIALAMLTPGWAAYLNGEWLQSRVLFEKAEQRLRGTCAGAAWELDASQLFSLLCSTLLGDLPALRRRYYALQKEAHDRGDVLLLTSLITRIGYMLYLAQDRAPHARRLTTEAIGRWSRRGSHLQHMWNLFAQVEFDLYEGAAESAWRRLEDGWGRVRSGRILHIQVSRILAYWLRGRCALAAAASTGSAAMIRAAERDAARIARERAAWGQGIALLLQAGVAAQRENYGGATEALFEAEAGLEASHMRLLSVLARLRRGQLQKGDAGSAAITEAEECLRELGIEVPERFAAMLTPMRTPKT